MKESAVKPSEGEENPVNENSIISKNSKWSVFWKIFREHIAVVSACALVVIIILLIVTIILLLQRDPSPMTPKFGSDDVPNATHFGQATPEGSQDPDEFKTVSRLEWAARPAIEAAHPLAAPVPYVIILHTSTENCSSRAECVLLVRLIQTFHMESRHWWDIGYNFLVGGDGDVYEGRGWKAEGAHTYGYNAKSVGIAFIGTFNNFKPPRGQIAACRRLIAKGVELGYIRRDHKLLAARQLQVTQSPGVALYEEMKTWEHWVPAP